MARFCCMLLVALIAVGSALGQQRREQKNLRNTFPFNGGQQQSGASRRFGRPQQQSRGFNSRQQQAPAFQQGHGHHAHAADPIRDSRQRGGGDDADLSIGAIAAAGERCIDKVVMVEETEYDDVVTCKHSYSEKCHTTYTTDFEPQQEEDCEENFVKSCFIEYRKQASEDTVTFCYTPLELQGGGPEVCKKVFESHCVTRYEEHDVDDDVVTCETIQEEKCEDVTQGYTTEQKCTKWPRQVCDAKREKTKKYSPQTECKKIPREVCGPGSTQVPGQEECFDRKETVIIEVPEETCNLEPQRQCKHVTKLVPLLKPTEECVDIPKEVCSRSRTNPRKVQKPVVKKWCYVPTAQSGLA